MRPVSFFFAHPFSALKEMAIAHVKPDQLTYALMLSAEGENKWEYVEEVTSYVFHECQIFKNNLKKKN